MAENRESFYLAMWKQVVACTILV